ncbi:MAG: VWA domain-containing protein [Chloroflexota bacterium]
MIFRNPASFILVLFVPIMAAFLVWRFRMRAARLARLGDSAVIAAMLPKIAPSRRFGKLMLWFLALVSLIVALARPVWGEEISVLDTQGVSVMIVLDVSNSMNAQDVAPSRLERAKLSLGDLIDGLAGNEIGLILFAGNAYVQFPLTTDTLSAKSFLGTVNTDAITRQGTNIGAALQLAIDRFRNRGKIQPIVILVTDGENFEGDPLSVAAAAKEAGITIHAIGYGNPEGSAIPVYDANGQETGYKTDAAGNLVMSALDESTLKAIADATGGTFQRATAGGTEINTLLGVISKAQVTSLGTRSESRGVERFGIFVALAVIALSIEILLPEVRKAKA